MATNDDPFNEYNSLPIVKSIERKLRKQIVLLQVIPDGIRNHNILFVTKSGEVYGFGNNTDGCLGVGHNKPVLEKPCPIKELQDKQVVQFCTGRRFVMALTRFGEIWSWGDNSCGQLALEQEPDDVQTVNVPNLVPAKFPKSCSITRVACGSTFGAIVNTYGDVYTVGSNMFGQLALDDRYDYTTKLEGVWLSNPVEEISCGANHIAMLTADHKKVYVCGDNQYGQLGVHLASIVWEAKELDLPLRQEQTIKAIACGAAHTLILLTSGIIYALGDNRQAQLAARLEKGTCSGDLHLVQMAEMFEQIYCINLSNISVAKSATRKDQLYVWGPIKSKHAHRAQMQQSTQWKTMYAPASTSTTNSTDDSHYILMQPRRSYVSSVAKLFALYDPGCLTYSEKCSNTHKGRPSAIGKWFNLKELADVHFIIGGERLYAHKTVLVTYSDYFYRYFGFAPDKMPSSGKVSPTTICICDYSYPVFRAYLSFIYLGSIYTDSKAASPTIDQIRFLVQLTELALTYEETDLYEECMRELTAPELMCPRWVTHIYHQAYQYQVDSLVNLCLQFMLAHWEQMLQQPDFERRVLVSSEQTINNGKKNSNNNESVSKPTTKTNEKSKGPKQQKQSPADKKTDPK